MIVLGCNSDSSPPPVSLALVPEDCSPTQSPQLISDLASEQHQQLHNIVCHQQVDRVMSLKLEHEQKIIKHDNQP